MKIRAANHFDAEGVAKASAVLGYDQPSSSDVAKQLAEICSSTSANVWVCEMGSEIVGWVHAEKMSRLASKPFVEILGIAVASEFQHKGVGSKLVQVVINWATSIQMGVRVRTNENRTQAIKFYAKYGFKKVKNQQVFQWHM
jgi:Acetyltransferases